MKTELEILVEFGVLRSTDPKENFNLQITRDCYVGTVHRIVSAMTAHANQFKIDIPKAKKEKVAKNQIDLIDMIKDVEEKGK